MSNANATVTGITGPGKSLTAQVFTNCSSINFNLVANTIEIVWTPVGKNTSQREFIEYDNIATVTYTISGTTATVSISS